MPPDRWLELRVLLPAEDRRPGPDLESVVERVSFHLLELGGRAVEELEGELRTYLPPPGRVEELLDRIRDRLEAAYPGEGLQVRWRWQAQEDWETLWRRGLDTRRITPRLVVTPSWIPVRARPGERVLTLDPGMAFGTAEHPTTRSSLRLLDPRVRPGCRIADVGAGSGILSIAAAVLGAAEVVAFEADPLACETARENVEANGVSDRIRIQLGVVGSEGELPGFPFEGLVANLQTFIHLPLLDLFRRSVAPDGWVILAGILTAERERLLSAAETSGLALESQDEEGEWWAGAFTPGPPGGTE